MSPKTTPFLPGNGQDSRCANFQQIFSKHEKLKIQYRVFEAPLNRSDTLLALDTRVVFIYSFTNLSISPCIQPLALSRGNLYHIETSPVGIFMIGISIMKELKKNLKSNLKFKFRRFGIQPRYEALGGLREKLSPYKTRESVCFSY